MERYITVDGTERLFKVSGATPRIYRGICGRDLMIDMMVLEKSEEYTPDKLLIYEDLAYTMAKQGNEALKEPDPDFPKTPDEWLDTIEVLDIYDLLPEITKLWRQSNETKVDSKKKDVGQNES